MEAIVQAATQVFERHGYAAGTTNRIAERAGVSIGTLYQYFPNKDAILLVLLEEHLEQGQAALTPLMAELTRRPVHVRTALRRVMQALFELHRHQPNLHRVLFEEAPRPREIRVRLDAAFDWATLSLAGYLDRRAEVTVPDTTLAAQLVIQTLEAVTHGLVIHPRADVSPSLYTEAATTMLVRYLTAKD